MKSCLYAIELRKMSHTSRNIFDVQQDMNIHVLIDLRTFTSNLNKL